MKHSGLACLALAIILSGCAGAPPDPPAVPTPPQDVAGFDITRVPLDCPGGACYEPTVVADLAGRLFATNVIPAGAFAVSFDEGRTWTNRSTPPIPVGISAAHQNDATLIVAPSGTLYFSAMIIRQTTLPTGTVPVRLFYEGLQVAWSEDAGETWQTSFLTAFRDPESMAVQADRQWLAFGPDGEVYLLWFQQPTGHWIARSDDGGATWGTPTRVAGLEGGHAGNHGPPVVDANGRVHIPMCVFATGKLYALTSEDGGATFAKHVVASDGCIWSPMLVVAKNGTLVAAWHDNAEGGVNSGGNIQVATSHDQGTTWSAPVRWGQDSHTSPWPMARPDGRIDLVWLRQTASGTSSQAIVSRGLPSAEPELSWELSAFAPGGSVQNTDFAHGSHLPDGRVVLTWAEPGAIYVGVERP